MTVELIGENVSAGYSNMEIIRNVSFSVREGEVVSVVGPNGSGKSTLLKSVFGLCDVFSGSISFEDNDIRRTAGHKLVYMGISYVPQTDNIFTNMTVIENLELGWPNNSPEPFEKRLDEVEKLFPVVAERAKQQAGKLSGGERQMVALARALMANPKIVLMDEPTAMLSPKFVSEIFRRVVEMKDRGIGILIVEQNARKALEFADRAYVMIHGQIVVEGEAKQIANNQEVERLFLGRRRTTS